MVRFRLGAHSVFVSNSGAFNAHDLCLRYESHAEHRYADAVLRYSVRGPEVATEYGKYIEKFHGPAVSY